MLVDQPKTTLASVNTAQRFFTLVDRHVTGPVEEAGYAKLGEYDGLRADESAVLTQRDTRIRPLPPVGITRLWRRDRTTRVRVLEVGYERLLGEDDERWLRYTPDTGELDITSWRDALRGYADWDVWHDRAVPTEGELERRLQVLGSAVRALGRQ